MLGYCHDMYGLGPELWWSDDHSSPPRHLRVSNFYFLTCASIELTEPTQNRAGFFPGAIYLCSYWYMPKDLSTRISYFYCASALSGAFSGLLAAAIAKMDGIGGQEGWRWIFILEGLATVVLGAATFFFLIDTPALSTRWLEPEEIRYLELSMVIKQGGTFQEDTGFKWRDLTMVLTNWRVYVQAYFLLVQSALSYGKYSNWCTTRFYSPF